MRRLLRWVVPVGVVAAGVLAVSVSGGCGTGTPAPESATVRGRLTLNGQPVASGVVVFTPDPRRGGRGKSAHAQTGPDGAFHLSLDNAHQIPAGWYRVSLAGPPAVRDPVAASPTPVFPAKLARPDMSGLEREVQAGKEHFFEFAVEVPAQ